MQWLCNPSTYRPIDGQTALFGVVSGKHWEECRHLWKTLAPSRGKPISGQFTNYSNL